MRIDVRVQNHFVKNTSKKTALKQNTFVRVFNHGFSDKTTQNVQKTIEKHRKSFWFTVSFYKTAFSYCLDGGQRWIRTTEVWDVRFTVWSIWPLWNLSVWCLEVESNHRQRDFQSLALPTELSRRFPFYRYRNRYLFYNLLTRKSIWKTSKKMATQTRLELVTSSVTGWRSNQTELLGRAI